MDQNMRKIRANTVFGREAEVLGRPLLSVCGGGEAGHRGDKNGGEGIWAL